MEAENLVSLFDVYWFEVEILKIQREPSNCESNPVEELPNRSLTTISTKKSMDENIEIQVSFSSESSNNSSVSPSSVLEGRGDRKKKLERGFSKSLSDLEFEELKGFMDLGFVFSQEDKGSEFLTTIVPGLQLLGEEDKQIGNIRRKSVNGSSGSEISRPYLSEAWKVSEMNKIRRRKRENQPLVMSSDKLPSARNKIHMKDYLKSWAHNVASFVK